MALQVGDKAPGFSLSSSTGREISLAGLLGKKVVLYFYPKDDTPGCTVEACGFRDINQDIADAGAVVLGVSADGLESHDSFIRKFDLNFPLLADTDGRVSEAYGVWRERSVSGGTAKGIERSTFLIDENGVVVEVWRRVEPKGHMEMLVELLGNL